MFADNVSTSQNDKAQKFHELRAFHQTFEEIVLCDVPDGTVRVCAQLASGESIEALHDGQWTLSILLPGTYAVQAIDEKGRILEEIITTVDSHPGVRPVHGFATSFRDEDIPSILNGTASPINGCAGL